MRNSALVLAAILALLPHGATAEETGARGTLLAPKAFRAAAGKVLPSIVTIEGFGGIPSGSGAAGVQAAGEGPTTGLVLSADGYIITSTFNFLRKPPIITVVLPGGERKVAKLLGRDETRKLCILKIDGVDDLAVPELAPRDALRVGQWAVALGIGYGDPQQPALSAGIISALSRISGKAVQTDANLSPANYGGPLIDIDGRVIGICVPLSPQSREAAAGAEWYDSGIGFAVPLSDLERIIGAMKEGRTLEAAHLGIQAQQPDDSARGAAAKAVEPGSPAEKAGLKPGDRIVAVAGTDIQDPAHLATVIGRYVAGDQVEIVLMRGEEKITVAATFSAPPPPMPTKPDAK